MKKMKWLVSLLVAFLLMSVAAPIARAQVNLEEFFTKVQEANKDFTSGHLAGTLAIALDQNGQSSDLGQIKFDMKGNLKDEISGQTKFDVVSAMFGSQQIGAEIFFKDNTLTVISTDKTEVKQVEEAKVNDFKVQFETYKKQLTETAIADQVANAEKYLDVTETADSYVVSFKKDIDMKAFWESVMTPEKIAQIKEQAAKQAEQAGQPLTEEVKKTMDKVYDPAFLSKLISEAPAVEMHYAKDTYLLTKYTGTVNLNLKAAAELVASEAQSANLGSLPEKATLKVDVTIDGHNEPQEIVVPEVTETTETSMSDSSMEESSSSAE